MTVELKITGMHCAGCVASVENALRKVEGVEEAVVNLTLEKATVLGSVDPTQLIQSWTKPDTVLKSLIMERKLTSRRKWTKK